MDPFFDFDELFGDLEGFNSKLMKRIQRHISETEKAIKNGKLKGDWDVKRIDKPGVQGYIIQGRFWTDQPFKAIEPFDPFEPLRPWRRRPMPQRPFKVPESATKEIREPLTDVFEEDDAIRIYVELPGEEKDDIQLNIKEGKVEIKTKKFYKIVDLPRENSDTEKITQKYKNGVLEVTIPRKEKAKPKYYKL
ncbi:MAG: Hsp20/alpha crystallin family protein [Candidatus Bathyarchaeota archaeon]|nr:Hsp20/alpha crystallin family protein [Candidatus Bathyarchaeota archaeon]